MDLYSAIAARRSIRRFKSDPVPDAALTRILEAGRLAPSGTNVQPWKFLVVRSDETRVALQGAAYNQAMLTQAPVLLVVLGDRKAFKKRLRRGRELVDIGAVDGSVLESVGKAYREAGKGAGDNDTAIALNCCIAVEHLVLAAVAEGLGSCWVRLYKAEEVARALRLPDHLFPVAILPIGYADQEPSPRPRYSLEEIACKETVDTPWTEG